MNDRHLRAALHAPSTATPEELERTVAERMRELRAMLERCRMASDIADDVRRKLFRVVLEEEAWRAARRRAARTVAEPDGPELSRFPPVTFDDDNVPRETFVPPRRHSYYRARHVSEPDVYPLSTRVFDTRYEITCRGREIHGDDWILDQRRTVHWYVDPIERRRRVRALTVNERYEPRWGTIFCTGASARPSDLEWQDDLATHPITVFVDLAGPKKELRYCGEWRFELLTDPASERTFPYLCGEIRRRGVYRVTLSHYDDRWGARAGAAEVADVVME